MYFRPLFIINFSVKKIVCFLLFGLFLINICSDFLFCSNQSEPIFLLNADELIGENTSDGSNNRELVGNVRLRQGNVIITSDYAYQYLGRNTFLLKGNVIINQDTLTLYSSSVHYDANTNIARSDSTLKIVSGNQVLIGESGEYNTRTNIAIFRKNVTL